MSDQTIKFQARIYVYDMNNYARDFGFKADDNWEISMSAARKMHLSRDSISQPCQRAYNLRCLARGAVR
jgi:hypothetical protein